MALLFLLFIIGFSLAAYAAAAVLDDEDQSIVAWGVFLLALTSVFFISLPDIQRRVWPSDYPYSSFFVAGFPLEAVGIGENPCCSMAERYYFVFFPALVDWMFFALMGSGLIMVVKKFIPFKKSYRVMIAFSVVLLSFTGLLFLISKDDDYSVIFSRHIDVEQACLDDNDCMDGHRGGKGG